MKRKIQSLVIVGLLLVIAIACQREERETLESKGISLEQAKAFFEKQETEKENNGIDFKITPKWETFKEGGKNNCEESFSYVKVNIDESTFLNCEILFTRIGSNINTRLILRKEPNKKIGKQIIIFSTNGRAEEIYYINQKGVLIGGFIKEGNENLTRKIALDPDEEKSSNPPHYDLGPVDVIGRAKGGRKNKNKVQNHRRIETSFFYRYGGTSYMGMGGRDNPKDKKKEREFRGGSTGSLKDKKEDQIIDRITNEKIKCLHDKLRSGNNDYVKEIFSKFEGNGTEFDIVIKSEPRVRDSKGIERSSKGITWRDGKTINIRISETFATGAPALELAKTIFHEYIHADIFRKLKTKDDENLPEIKSFRETYDEYTKKFSKEKQHEYMAKHYVKVMSDALKKFHQDFFPDDITNYEKHMGEKVSDKLYEALAWIGLKEHGVKAYEELSDDEKEKIKFYEARASMLSKNCN